MQIQHGPALRLAGFVLLPTTATQLQCSEDGAVLFAAAGDGYCVLSD